METKQISGDFVLFNFADNHIQATLKNETTKYVLMTGSDVPIQLPIPYAHRLVKIILRHTTSAKADSIDPLDVQIKRVAGGINIIPELQEILMTQADIVDANITMTFGDGFEYEPSTWNIILNSTNTDRVYIALYFQRLGGTR